MFKLKWKGETIEEDIETLKEAEYLRGEYSLAYGGGVSVHRQNGRVTPKGDWEY